LAPKSNQDFYKPSFFECIDFPGVLYPTAIVNGDDHVIGEMAYFVSRYMPHELYLRYAQEVAHTMTSDGFRVYGATAPTLFPPTGCDLHSLPAIVSQGVCVFPDYASDGHSADLAISIAALQTRSDVTPAVLFTGAVRDNAVYDVLLVADKKTLIHDNAIEIAGGTAGVPGTTPISTVSAALSYARDHPLPQ